MRGKGREPKLVVLVGMVVVFSGALFFVNRWLVQHIEGMEAPSTKGNGGQTAYGPVLPGKSKSLGAPQIDPRYDPLAPVKKTDQPFEEGASPDREGSSGVLQEIFDLPQKYENLLQ